MLNCVKMRARRARLKKLFGTSNDPGFTERHRLYMRKWRKTEDRQKRIAHSAVRRALASGELVRKPCKVCGAKAEAHHPNYFKPLEVVWLCPSHHNEEHRKVKHVK